MWEKAVDIWNAACEEYPMDDDTPDADIGEISDNIITYVIEEIRGMDFDDLKILADKYLEKKPAKDAFKEMDSKATFRHYLEEVVYKAAVEYTI